MQTVIIANAFSLQMLAPGQPYRLNVMPIANPRAWLDHKEMQGMTVISVVGHSDTASLFSAVLKRKVPVQRVGVMLDAGCWLLVGQVTGGRLPEGCKSLPAGFELVWWTVNF